MVAHSLDRSVRTPARRRRDRPLRVRFHERVRTNGVSSVGFTMGSLCEWVQSGRKQPLADYFYDFAIQRFEATIAGIVFLGLGLGWSISLMRPLRLIVRFRLRTLMAVIAVVPIDLTACADVWNRWEQWNADRKLAPYQALLASMPQEI
jgi:hypothetical protein